MNVRELSEAAKLKGVDLLTAGDFTHPKHLEEIKKALVPSGDGFYEYNDVKFVLTTEVSNIYTQGGRGRRLHNLIFAPSFEVVDQINDALLRWGRLDYDGRPMFGHSSIELVDLVLGVSKDCEVIPAHAWTPWYGVLGSKSGFDSLEECFEDRTKHIHAIETGLSSDPAMNWRLSKLDDITLVSFSDSHSPYPWRLGREATVFDIKQSYYELVDTIRKKDPKRLLYTIEVDPAYGKYHYDGHRKCDVSMSPAESKKHDNKCPKCGQPLTIGVENRVEQLADRLEGYKPDSAVPFKRLIPLSEMIAALYGTQVFSKTVFREANALVQGVGSELGVLLDTPREQLLKITQEKIVDAIMLNREGKIQVKPGYDGVYGEPQLESIKEKKTTSAGQKTLGEY